MNLHIPHPPKPSLRGMFHVIGAIAFSVLGVVLIVQATGFSTTLAASVYAVSVTAAMATSALYHRIDWSDRWNRVMRKADHSMIYVWIAATYTPILVIANATTLSWVLLTSVWAATMIGIGIRLFMPTPPRWMRAGMPIALGMGALVMFPKMLEELAGWMVFMVAFGGFLYILGAIAYMTKWPNPWPRHFGFHEVFHVFVVAAAVCHYSVMYPLVAGAA